MPEQRILTFAQALHEALDICLARDRRVYLMGLGVADPKGVFGTTLGLVEKYGTERVLETPVSENAMTGIAIGSSLLGERPVLMHQRVEFALLSFDQIVNNAAKWHYMYGGQASVPMVIRLVIGRGWGQGAQHSQSLENVFAHIPGLKVVMPATVHDAKGMLIAAIEDDNPIIFLEHRWLHYTKGPVPEGHYAVPLGRPRIACEGRDVTIVATSYMVVESLLAAEVLRAVGCSAEVIDVRTLRPLDIAPIVESVAKTGRLITVDVGWRICGFGAEVVASIVERCMDGLKAPPVRLGMADHPSPSSPGLIPGFYPRAEDIVERVAEMTGLERDGIAEARRHVFSEREALPLDVPDPHFSGPF